MTSERKTAEEMVAEAAFVDESIPSDGFGDDDEEEGSPVVYAEYAVEVAKKYAAQEVARETTDLHHGLGILRGDYEKVCSLAGITPRVYPDQIRVRTGELRAELAQATARADATKDLLVALRSEWATVVLGCTVDTAEMRTPESRAKWEADSEKLRAEYPDEDHGTWEECIACPQCDERLAWIARVDEVIGEASNDQ